MKGSTIVVFGGLVAVGAVSYCIYKYKQASKDKTDSLSVCVVQNADNLVQQASEVGDFVNLKTDTSEIVSDRHEKASRVISESLQTIFRESNSEDFMTENMGEMDTLDIDLEDLLK